MLKAFIITIVILFDFNICCSYATDKERMEIKLKAGLSIYAFSQAIVDNFITETLSFFTACPFHFYDYLNGYLSLNILYEKQSDEVIKIIALTFISPSKSRYYFRFVVGITPGSAAPPQAVGWRGEAPERTGTICYARCLFCYELINIFRIKVLFEQN